MGTERVEAGSAGCSVDRREPTDGHQSSRAAHQLAEAERAVHRAELGAARSSATRALELARAAGEDAVAARALAALAHIAYGRGRMGEGDRLAGEADRAARLCGDRRAECLVAWERGVEALSKGESAASTACAAQILDRGAGDPALVGRGRLLQARIASKLSSAAEAEAHATAALAAARSAREPWLEAAALCGLAFYVADWKCTRDAEALRHVEEARALCDRWDLRVLADRAEWTLAVLHTHQSRYDLALAHFERALALAEREEYAEVATLSYQMAIAEVARALRDYPRSFRACSAALEICLRRGERIHEPRIRLSTALALGQLGRPKEALHHAERALTLARDSGSVQMEIEALHSLGICLRYLASHERSVASLRHALELGDATGDRCAILEAHRALAYTFLEARRPREALRHADAVADMLQPGDAARTHRGSRRLRAEVLLALGETDEAAREVGPALEAGRRHGVAIDQAEVLFLAARIDAARGRRERATARFDEALAILDAQTRAQVAPFARRGLAESFAPELEAATEHFACSAPPDVDRSFQILDGSSGRILADHTAASGSVDPSAGAPARLVERQGRLAGLLAAQQRDLAATESGSAEETRLRRDVGASRRALDEVARAIELEHPLYAAMAGTAGPVSLDDFRATSLARGEVFLHYRVLERRTVLLAVGRDLARVFDIDVDRDELRSLVDRCTSPMQPELLETYDAQGAARELHALLLAPAEPAFRGARRLVIRADGALLRLPFELLPLDGTDPWDRGFHRCRHLLDRFEIAYVEGAALLRRDLHGRRRASVPYVGLGDPEPVNGSTVPAYVRRAEAGAPVGRLPHTATEVRRSASSFPGGRVFLRAEATESAYRRHAPRARYVHIATHGWVDEEEPRFSGLALSPGSNGTDGDAGFLQAFEIQSLPLAARLVVLSACGTARGKATSTEGIVGLARSFRLAGARSVLGTVWPVHDESSAILANLFFDSVARAPRRNLAAHLRDAKLRMLRPTPADLAAHPARAVFRHPYYWAGYVLVGTGR